MIKTGKVYLVGAGPGDPRLITIKGLDCLKKADVIVYDRLLDEHLLKVASPTIELIYVGKKAGEHITPQDEINQLLVGQAKEGKTVVRLKGGDPFILGRGGEEAEVLVQNKIAFEIVPGITSAIAVPAYAGIPITHRRLASSFTVITGHEDPEKNNSSINWEKLATGVDTLIFLMGMKNLPAIVAKLVEYGRPRNTPIAVIKEGTHPEQITVVGHLEDIVAKVEKYCLVAPAIIVVGNVVRLREKLRWFDNRPLFGKRILVTRAQHQASTLSRLLSEHGAQPIELPVINIQIAIESEELNRALSNLGHYHWVIFSSTNSVEAFWQCLHSLRRDSRALDGLKIGAIGPATAQSLEKRGITPDLIPEVYTSEGVVAGLNNQNVAGQRFLLPRSDIADRELEEGICRLGATVDNVIAYRTTPSTESISRVKQMISSGNIDVITFTSSSTVSSLMAMIGKEPMVVNGVMIACIGPKTAETAIKFGLSVNIMAKEQTIPDLVSAIEEFFGEET
ncbi:uroporphyrinogen-III C-methyltransferase [Chloroflexota bacterium]